MPTGTVKWFNATKGYGFIELEDGSKDAVVSRNRSWNPHGNWSQCSVAGFPGMTEQSGSGLEPLPF